MIFRGYPGDSSDSNDIVVHDDLTGSNTHNTRTTHTCTIHDRKNDKAGKINRIELKKKKKRYLNV